MWKHRDFLSDKKIEILLTPQQARAQCYEEGFKAVEKVMKEY